MPQSNLEQDPEKWELVFRIMLNKEIGRALFGLECVIKTNR
jgi:hypothetical protein